MTPNANLDRAIFLLHKRVLDPSGVSQIKIDHQTKCNSRAALDMACQMVVDTARYRGLEGLGMMPFCCYYNLRNARQHLKERNIIMGDEALYHDIEFLLQCEERYCKKWRF
jgi:hypothetical protein